MPTCRPNPTTNHFKNITKLTYILTAINFWFEDVKLSPIFIKFHNIISKFLEAFVFIFVVTSIGARYTQHNLTEKQDTDVIMKSVSGIFVYSMYGSTLYHREGIKDLLFTLTVVLKEFNDENVERRMIRKTFVYLVGMFSVGFSVVTAYGVEGAAHALTSNATFTTAIPIWPDLEDRSIVAGVFRVLVYITWLVLVAHVVSIYSIIITVSICLGFQFTNLCEYFLSLNGIFDGDGDEERYEDAVKYGIKMHAITLNCVDQLKATCKVAYSGQVILNVSLMLLLMIQIMQSNRSLAEMAPIVFMAAGVLVSSGLFLWSAGDITFETFISPGTASTDRHVSLGLAIIMYSVGWHNCRGRRSVRVRKLITIAMTQAQRPVVITGLGIIELSYESYVAIVKSSYSVFSVIYCKN